ncbi:DUF3035 domain-containing protein [Alphaproteobacteria bacterium]|nr:DUF3035 domain-containing protein [Alphaproteobacteria bacterium]
MSNSVLYKSIYILCMTLLIGLSACGGSLGLTGMTSKAPDEFAVIKKEPLIIPPDFSLRPPDTGFSPPNSSSPSKLAKSAIFDKKNNTNNLEIATSSSRGEIELIKLAEKGKSNPEIRKILREDYKMLSSLRGGLVERIISQVGGQNSLSEVVKPEVETKRLQEKQATGEIGVPGQAKVIIRRK